MIKKDKIFELKIEEDDELSGIDSISLVDEPAIEVNWMFFNKEKPHEFHIPDGEDDKYIEKLISIAQDEQELFDEGWVVDSVTIVGDNQFVSTNPNGPSIEDEKEYNVRYKYILNPRITGQSAVIKTTRDFCKSLIAKNFVWRVEDMEKTQNDFGDSAMVWRGGANCRHVWSRILYKKDATIVNKASVNKGKVEVGGFPNDLKPDPRVLGYDEPSTVTSKTLANPSKSTIKNLGLSKENMEIIPPNVNVYGYHTRFFQICPGAQATFEHLVSMDNDDDTKGMIRSAAQVADNVFRIEDEVIKAESATQHQYEEAVILVDDFKDIINEVDKISGMVHDVSYMDGHIKKIKEYLKEEFESVSDYPDSVKNNAKAVLKYVEENGWGSCGTEVGKIRANQLANGEPISLDTVQRMYSYLSRHAVDLESSKGYGDGCGKLMYDSWGGKSALSWAESKLNDFGYDVSTIGGYEDPNVKKKKKDLKFAADEEQRTIIGPAMVPNLRIPRKDSEGNKYEVYFSAETIKMIADKYMKNQYTRNNDLMHDGTAVKDIYVVESWIKESDEDKSTKYGFGDLGIGTWFVAMKCSKTPEGDKVWEMVKNGDLAGYSVSGWFEEVAQFCREEMFLKQVAEILKKY
jgi:hypothetical protein